jgi:hypothetical protein
VEKYGTATQDKNDNITLRMRFARWITKATDTRSEYIAKKSMLIHGNNGFATALHSSVDTLLVVSFSCRRALKLWSS